MRRYFSEFFMFGNKNLLFLQKHLCCLLLTALKLLKILVAKGVVVSLRITQEFGFAFFSSALLFFSLFPSLLASFEECAIVLL